MKHLIKILILFCMAGVAGCRVIGSPVKPEQKAWHVNQREYQDKDYEPLFCVPLSNVKSIQVGDSMTIVKQKLGVKPAKYYKHPEFALVLTKIDGKYHEAAFQYDSNNNVMDISFSPISSEQESRVYKQQLLEIAKREIAKHETWTEISPDFYPVQKEDGTWIVIAWGINADGKIMQDRQRIISFDKNGKVIKYLKGY